MKSCSFFILVSLNDFLFSYGSFLCGIDRDFDGFFCLLCGSFAL